MGVFAGRPARLAGASSIALAALLGCPSAQAACSFAAQTVSVLRYPGPVVGDGGVISVKAGASVAGDPTGVAAGACGILALANSGGIFGASFAVARTSGGIGVLATAGQTIGSLTNSVGARIAGGTGGGGTAGDPVGAAGGAGVSSAGTIRTLSDAGAIDGGSGGVGHGEGGAGGAGGAGALNSGVITTLANTGAIGGGTGGGAGFAGGAGGSGLWNTGRITALTNGGRIAGAAGAGVSFLSGRGGGGGAGVSNGAGAMIQSLDNRANSAISGGNGGGASVEGTGGEGGVGVSSAGAIAIASNEGSISGGTGGVGNFEGGAGGAGLWNSGAITTLTSSGKIAGGGAGFEYDGQGRSGGAGLVNSGTIGTLRSSGAIDGGNGTSGGQGPGAGGAGVSNGGAITTLVTSGAVSGGNGGVNPGGAGGAGVSNAGTIKTLTNSGAIGGGKGGAFDIGAGGAGGAGIANTGTIGAVANSGSIAGGAGGTGPAGKGAAGDAIDSAGAHASIGPITNSGRIVGKVEIDNQASVTVNGGTGRTYGSWTGGTIAIGAGNLDFAGGNTALGDAVNVRGGAGTVSNAGALRLAAPVAIDGGFTQTGSGVLDSVIAGDARGEYGALAVSSLATLGGGLALDLSNGFTLAAGDVFDVMTFARVGGSFSRLSLDGAGCSRHAADVWSCSDLKGLSIEEVFGTKFLNLEVVKDPLGGAVPEPSTWAMLAAGFAGLGVLAALRRGKTTV